MNNGNTDDLLERSKFGEKTVTFKGDIIVPSLVQRTSLKGVEFC